MTIINKFCPIRTCVCVFKKRSHALYKLVGESFRPVCDRQTKSPLGWTLGSPRLCTSSTSNTVPGRLCECASVPGPCHTRLSAVASVAVCTWQDLPLVGSLVISRATEPLTTNTRGPEWMNRRVGTGQAICHMLLRHTSTHSEARSLSFSSVEHRRTSPARWFDET